MMAKPIEKIPLSTTSDTGIDFIVREADDGFLEILSPDKSHHTRRQTDYEVETIRATSLNAFLRVQAQVFKQRSKELDEYLRQGFQINPSAFPPPHILYASEILPFLNSIDKEEVALTYKLVRGAREITSMFGLSPYSSDLTIQNANREAQYWNDIKTYFHRLKSKSLQGVA